MKTRSTLNFLLALLVVSCFSSLFAQSAVRIEATPQNAQGYLIWDKVAAADDYRITLSEQDLYGRSLGTRTVSLSENYYKVPPFQNARAERYSVQVEARARNAAIGVSDVFIASVPDDYDGPGTIYCSYECLSGGFQLRVVDDPTPYSAMYLIQCVPPDEANYRYLSYDAWIAGLDNGTINSPHNYIDGYDVIDLGVQWNYDYCNNSGISLYGQHVLALRILYPYDGTYVQTVPIADNPCPAAADGYGLQLTFNLYQDDPFGDYPPISCTPDPCIGMDEDIADEDTVTISGPDWIDSLFAGFTPCDLGLQPDDWCGGTPDLGGGILYDPQSAVVTVMNHVGLGPFELADLAAHITLYKVDERNPVATRLNIQQLDQQYSGKPRFDLDLSRYGKGLYNLVVVMHNGEYLKGFFAHDPGPSRKAAVAEATAQAPEVMVYPNPTRTDATLRIKIENASDAQLRVTDMMGRSVYTTNLSLPAGRSTHSLPVGGFTNGIYHVEVKTGSGRIVRRLQVAR